MLTNRSQTWSLKIWNASTSGSCNKFEELLDEEKLEEKEYLSWSAHFASLQTGPLSPTAITSLLPLFEENAHSKAIILHAMKLVKDAIQSINPGQEPVSKKSPDY